MPDSDWWRQRQQMDAVIKRPWWRQAGGFSKDIRELSQEELQVIVVGYRKGLWSGSA
jgi:hypothetical protein